MKVTELYKIIISKEKIIDYLLSLTHTKGKHKAIYFNQFGFSENNWELFSEGIKEIVENNDITKKVLNNYGTKFVVVGEITAPSNIKIQVRTVWIVLKNQNTASLVTVYPI